MKCKQLTFFSNLLISSDLSNMIKNKQNAGNDPGNDKLLN